MKYRAPVPFEYVNCTDDKVFVYDSESHVDTAYNSYGQVDGVAYIVKRNLQSRNSTLLAAGSAVGRVFCLMSTKWKGTEGECYSTPSSLDDLHVLTSTAFYISPNIICTSRHTVEVARYFLVGTYFTPDWRFLTSNVEDLLYTLQFPLDMRQSNMVKFNQAMAEKGLYFVDKIFPLTQEHANKFSHYRNLDPIPSTSYEKIKKWETPNDFVFLHVTRSTDKWLVPSATVKFEDICLIGYASEPQEQRSVRLEGENYTVRIVSFARIFGGFDVRFLAPGRIFPAKTVDSDGDIRLISHTASCEAASAGAPLIGLYEEDHPPTFTAVHVGGDKAQMMNFAIPATTTTFCMEWATHVLEDIQKAILSDGDCRIPQLVNYLKLIRKKWPHEYEHDAIRRVNSVLAQLDPKE